jgi:hypothetical protein
MGLAPLHAGLWYWCNRSEGVWTQAPATDQAYDLTTAWILWRAMAHHDVSAFVQGWMHASPVHTPFVPLVSALLMLCFGESRIAAEAVLPVFTALWLVATFAIVRRLYGTSTAGWTTALVSAFPVFLIYSRTYLFEHPLAAMFACACWALVVSDGFSRPLPTAVFGVMAGLTSLTRGGAPVYFAGPVLVTLWSIRATPDRTIRVQRFALASLGAALIAATWYIPNGSDFVSYIHRATYGRDALARVGSTSALSVANAEYYVTWIVAQGPGVPMLVAVVVGLLIGWWRGGAPAAPSRISMTLALVFMIDFIVLLVAAQHETARYFQPLMGIVAVGVVRSITAIRSSPVRLAVAVATISFATHHVFALSAPGYSASMTLVPYVHGVPLWHHKSYFAAVTDFYGIHPVSEDFHIGETVDQLVSERLPSDAIIVTLETPHPFFQPNGLQLEAVRRGLHWRFIWIPFVTPESTDAAREAFATTPIDAVLLRTGGVSPPNLHQLQESFPTLFDSHSRFRRRQTEMLLGDGSRVSVYVAGEPSGVTRGPALRMNEPGVHPRGPIRFRQARKVLRLDLAPSTGAQLHGAQAVSRAAQPPSVSEGTLDAAEHRGGIAYRWRRKRSTVSSIGPNPAVSQRGERPRFRGFGLPTRGVAPPFVTSYCTTGAGVL